jgi:hypothetical protein
MDDKKGKCPNCGEVITMLNVARITLNDGGARTGTATRARHAKLYYVLVSILIPSSLRFRELWRPLFGSTRGRNTVPVLK